MPKYSNQEFYNMIERTPSNMLGRSSSGLSTAGDNRQDDQQTQLCRILLKGVYFGHHFDGGTRGGTGEFYWYSTTSDGNVVNVIDSRNKKEFGRNGILTGVNERTWKDFGFVELFWGTETPKRGAITFSFSLLESDDSDEAKRIFQSGAEVANRAAKEFANKDYTRLTSDAVNFVNEILEVDDDDDAIQAMRGLNQITHYRIGEFLRLEGKRHDDQPTFAICMVIPQIDGDGTLPPETDFFVVEEKIATLAISKPVTKTINVPKDGSLAFFVRTRAVVHMLTGDDKLIARGPWITHRVPVKRGRFQYKLQNMWVYPADADVVTMFISDELRDSYRQ